MPDDASKVKHSVHKKKSTEDFSATPSAAGLKEQEPSAKDAAIKHIQEVEKEASLEAEKKIREGLGEEARLREPEPELPPDVEDAGVVSPSKEASDALKKDTVDIPVTEEEYKKGEHTKLDAKVTEKKEVFGAASIIALALFVGRLIKLAHHHAKRIIFKSASHDTDDVEKGE